MCRSRVRLPFWAFAVCCVVSFFFVIGWCLLFAMCNSLATAVSCLVFVVCGVFLRAGCWLCVGIARSVLMFLYCVMRFVVVVNCWSSLFGVRSFVFGCVVRVANCCLTLGGVCCFLGGVCCFLWRVRRCFGAGWWALFAVRCCLLLFVCFVFVACWLSLVVVIGRCLRSPVVCCC